MTRLKTDPNALFLGLMEKTQDPPVREDGRPELKTAPKKRRASESPIKPEDLEGIEPEDMSLTQLKAYARKQGITLGSARTKPEIFSLIKGENEEEKEKMVLVSANLPESLKRDIDKLVYQKKMAGEKTSITQIIRDSVEERLKKEKLR